MPSYLAIAFILLFASVAHADPEVTVTAIDPPPGSRLAAGEAAYLRIHYRSAQPLRFQARGAESGRRDEMTNAAPLYPAGEGEAIAWVAYRDYAWLPQLVLRVTDAQWQFVDEIRVDTELEWNPAAARSKDSAAWVHTLSDAQEQVVRDQLQAAHQSADEGAWNLLFTLIAWSVPGYFLLQWLAWRRLQGGWRRAGLLPLLVSVPVTLYTLFALLAGSTLWALVMLLTMPWLFAWLAGVMLLGRARIKVT